MKTFKSIGNILVLVLVTIGALAQSGYTHTKTFHIASSGGWDYIAVNPFSNKLYVSHGTQVNILDKFTGDSLGIIPNTIGVHGIAFVNDLHKGYTSNGRINSVTIFDLATEKILGQIATGENPDAIFYEPYSKKIITCNGRSKDLTVIDPQTDQVIATVPVGGKPETAVSDEAGKVFVNIEDKNEIAVIDINRLQVIARWPLAPGDSPTGLAIDVATKRLFAGCEQLLIVANATNGQVIAQLPIGEGCDGVGFDPATQLVFTSNGSGSMTVIKEKNGNTFSVLEHVVSKRGARTIAADPATHQVYMPTADFEPQAPGEKGRPKMREGSFQVLVFAKTNGATK